MADTTQPDPIEVPLMAHLAERGEQPDILFWVGCMGSFDDRTSDRVETPRLSLGSRCEELPDLALPDEDGMAVDIDRPSEPQRWVRTRGSSSLIRRIATCVQPLPRGDAKLVGRPWCSLALQTSKTSLLNR